MSQCKRPNTPNSLGRILIIDDEPAAQKAITRALLDTWTVACASSGKRGLELIEAFSPDVVIADWRLPGLHGVDLLNAINATAPNLPVVVITGYSSEQIAIASVGRARAYLKKPVSRSELNACVQRLVEETSSGQPPVPMRRGRIALNHWEHTVTVDDNPSVNLTAAEVRVFLRLWKHPGRVVSHCEIASIATGQRLDPSPRTAQISRRMIHQLRRKIEPNTENPCFIITVPSEGATLVVG